MVNGLLEGKNIRLRPIESDDVDFLVGCSNNTHWYEYDPIVQFSRADVLRYFEHPSQLATIIQRTLYVVEKRDGTKVGLTMHFLAQPSGNVEIGYLIVPEERGKGYGSEAAQITVDYLFLAKDIVRIQAATNVMNIGSQRVLEKVGFVKEGLMRKDVFARGEWINSYLYSILKEEWKGPKILVRI